MQVIAMSKESKDEHVVICGAGVIGAACAYFLTSKGVRCTIVESVGVACAASGKSGGFLARDWCTDELAPFARASFDLHAKLAASLDGAKNYLFRKLTTLNVTIDPRKESKATKVQAPDWLQCRGVFEVGLGGSTETTAQVHPELFTRTLVDAAVKTGLAKLVFARVTGLRFSDDGKRVNGVRVRAVPAPESAGAEAGDGKSTAGAAGPKSKEAEAKETVLDCDAAVIAMGPWSLAAGSWHDSAPWKRLADISGTKAYSVVLKPSQPEAITAHALFLTHHFQPVSGSRWRQFTPEVYPRSSGEVYVCAAEDELVDCEVEPLPADATGVVLREECLQTLLRTARSLSPHLAEPTKDKESKADSKESKHNGLKTGAELVRMQACYLPNPPSRAPGYPLIGPMPGPAGAYIATGA